MPNPKFIVSSRATKGGPTQQVTIPAAIARKLPQGLSIRWEVAVVKGGLFYKYLGTDVPMDGTPDVDLDFVPAEDLKTAAKAARAKPEKIGQVNMPEKPAEEVAADEASEDVEASEVEGDGEAEAAPAPEADATAEEVEEEAPF